MGPDQRSFGDLESPLALLGACLPAMPEPAPADLPALIEDVSPADLTAAVHQLLGAELISVTRAIAILGEYGDPFVLSRVLGLPLYRIGALFDELIAAGVLAPDHCLRSRVRAAVLAGTAPDVSRRLNMRAAEVLYEDAAPAPVVARHLLAAGVAPESWATGVLSEAATQAVRERRFDDAAALLGLALNWSAGPAGRAEIRFRLLDVRWWSDPDQAADLLTALAAAARVGHLAPDRIARLSRLMAWQGRAQDARDLLAMTGDQQTIGGRWIRHVFPGSLGAAVEPDAAAAEAVEMLRRVMPHEPDLEAAQIAVCTLLTLDRFDPDEIWYPPFARAVAAGGLPPWQSLLAGARATVALNGGEPARAAALARQALAGRPVGDGRWSVLLALPRAVLLMALTELGRHTEVAAALAVPPPADLTRSPYGLLHLRARGRHHLATGAPQSAADDFRAIGDALTSWGIESPGLLPWRTDLAEAVLRLDDRPPAPRLSRAEGKVARLASQGYTNREISGMLYITRSTVEQHLTRVYRKLGIDRRDELCDLL
ncbi:helix-turn-helix transcriptional regulator [Actinoplanes sp. NPDC026619]|uniref:helix-turn-helix transcriptional regulator n=1 Tax=Actinoplanes sp. NPDC026619 TaxID=3155798 RepID=UPI0033EC7640